MGRGQRLRLLPRPHPHQLPYDSRTKPGADAFTVTCPAASANACPDTCADSHAGTDACSHSEPDARANRLSRRRADAFTNAYPDTRTDT